MAYRLLVVEDDVVLGKGLEASLTADGYDVSWVQTAGDALDSAAMVTPSLVLLDLGLPDLDGVELCRRLRVAVPETTIVMATARADDVDAVVGLDAGADDYVTKPFRLAVLLARVRAHLRRRLVAQPRGPIAVGPLLLDQAVYRAELDGIELGLRPKEFELLALLMREAGTVVTRERIMAEVWDEHWFGSTKTLDMHISSLRKKLGEAADLVTTVRGVGYRLEQP